MTSRQHRLTRRQWLVASIASLGSLLLGARSGRAQPASPVAVLPRINRDDRAGDWRPTNVVDAPQRRSAHTAVWTGREMLVWGGRDHDMLNDGALYDPVRDSWTPISRQGAPAPRASHSAVWTGREMLVWGGRVSYSEDSVVGDGGRYDPATDTWRPMSAEGAPAARAACDAVWTGTELIIWGNVLGPVPDAQGLGPGYSDGARYDPLTDHWRPLPQIDLVGHLLLTRAVWIGDGLLVWGGRSDGPRVGAIYSPQTDRWTALRPSPAFEQPGTARFSDGRPAVWTGSEVIGWGGVGGKPFPVTGGFRYAPATQAWSALPTTGAPGERLHHTVVWTGQGVLVWGGGWIGRGTQTVDGGGWFDPEGDRWLPISDVDAPTPRVLHTAVWTGSEMIVWGGHNQWSAGSNGGVYTPAAG